jgi:undecaprenyl-diphosphatase
MKFLYLLEKIRNPFLDFFFSLITHIGEETFFLVIALLFFWCINKREGYYIMITGFIGTVINQALKLVFKIPRPWVKDPNFTIVENARNEATGYSFPSGHTQNAAGTFGSIGIYSKRRPVRIVSILIIVFVSFSRMYLGVHTPLDVGVSLLIAGALVFLLYPFFETEERFGKSMPYIIGMAAILSLGLLLYVILLPRESLDVQNYNNGLKNACTLFGCMLGMIPVYLLDRRFIRFETEAPWYAQIIKLILGLSIVVAIKVGLSAPLAMLFGNEYVARCVRYFFIVVFAGSVWPLSFGFFKKMRIPFLDGLFKTKQ